MKKIWTTILCLCLVAGSAAFFAACSNTEPEPEKPTVPDDAEPLAKASAIYAGDDLEPGLGHYMLALYSEDAVFDEDSWFFSGNGEFVWFELSAAMMQDLKNAKLVDGTYAAADFETFEEMTFQRGKEDMGSYLGEVENDEETLDPIVDGELKIESKGEAYTIRLTLKTESGEERKLKYEGIIPIQIFGVTTPADPFEGVFVHVSGRYFGNHYKTGVGNIELSLSDIQIEGGEPVYPGHTLYLDVNTTLFGSRSAIELVPGTYTCNKSELYDTPMTFNVGREEGEYLAGTLWVEYNSQAGEQNLYRITDGSMTVVKAGSNYEVTVNVKLDNGETRTGEYTGTISVNDASCLSFMTGDVSPACTKGRMIFRGDSQYFQNNSYNWTIWLATDGIDLDNQTGTGEMMQLDINTSRDSKTEISSGEYAVIKSILTTELIPFTYVPGYFDVLRESIMGSWYTKDLIAIGPAVSGTLKIENKGGDNYVIEYNFVDDYAYAPGPYKITGKYEGKLSYTDASAPMGAPAKVKSAGICKTQDKFKAAKRATATRRAVRR